GPGAILDVTDIPPGDYVLEVVLDTSRFGEDDDGADDIIRLDIVLVTGLACPATSTICDGACCPVGVACDLDDGGCQLPDLFVDEAVLFDTAEVQEIRFSEESCAVFEGCIDAPGNRRLLRFSTTT